MTAALLWAGCTEELDPLEGTTSLRVELISPSELGAADDRLDDGARAVTLRIEALDETGAVDTEFSGRIDFYAHHLGSLSPALDSGSALATVQMQGGVAEGIELELPRVFGPTFLWAENTQGDTVTFATGTSDTLWFRDPFLVDISQPPDEAALDARERSPLEEKQVVVTDSQYGARGRLVVTGSYAQSYTASDVECADEAGTPPCTTGDYEHIFVFTFSRPEAEGGGAIQPGHVIESVGGGVSEFNGLTEIGFPQTFLVDGERRPALIPEPILIDPAWLDTKIELERAEAALVAVEGGTVCPLDEDFDTFGQWKLDVGRGCGDAFNFITKGQVSELDPAQYVGQVLPRAVGTLRPINIGSFDVWIVYPRSIDDLTLPQ